MANISALFDVILDGSAQVAKDLWIDLGLIPTGSKLWIGYASYFSEDKNTTFSLHSNLTGQSTGSISKTVTKLWDSASCAMGVTVDRDLYRNGRTNTMTVAGTGVEHLWLHLVSKSQTLGDVTYILYYTVY